MRVRVRVRVSVRVVGGGGGGFNFRGSIVGGSIVARRMPVKSNYEVRGVRC